MAVNYTIDGLAVDVRTTVPVAGDVLVFDGNTFVSSSSSSGGCFNSPHVFCGAYEIKPVDVSGASGHAGLIHGGDVIGGAANAGSLTVRAGNVTNPATAGNGGTLFLTSGDGIGAGNGPGAVQINTGLLGGGVAQGVFVANLRGTPTISRTGQDTIIMDDIVVRGDQIHFDGTQASYSFDIDQHSSSVGALLTIQGQEGFTDFTGGGVFFLGGDGNGTGSGGVMTLTGGAAGATSGFGGSVNINGGIGRGSGKVSGGIAMNAGIALSSATEGTIAFGTIRASELTFGRVTINAVFDTDQILVVDGAANSPPYSFKSKTDAGMFWNSISSKLAWTHSSNEVMNVDSLGLLFLRGSGTDTLPALQIGNQSDNGLFALADIVAVTSGGVESVRFTNTGSGIITSFQDEMRLNRTLDSEAFLITTNQTDGIQGQGDDGVDLDFILQNGGAGSTPPGGLGAGTTYKLGSGGAGIGAGNNGGDAGLFKMVGGDGGDSTNLDAGDGSTIQFITGTGGDGAATEEAGSGGNFIVSLGSKGAVGVAGGVDGKFLVTRTSAGDTVTLQATRTDLTVIVSGDAGVGLDISTKEGANGSAFGNGGVGGPLLIKASGGGSGGSVGGDGANAGNISITGSQGGGATSGNAGDGTTITLLGGNGGSTDIGIAGDGGDIIVNAGTKGTGSSGTPVDGDILIGTTTYNLLRIGKTGISEQVEVRSANLIIGDGSSVSTITTVASASGSQLTVKPANHSSLFGPNLIFDAGTGTAANGSVIVGASNADNILIGAFGGTTPSIQICASGAKLGFFGLATPIVKQTVSSEYLGPTPGLPVTLAAYGQVTNSQIDANAYVSVTGTEISTASSLKFNVFSDASYPGTFGHTTHVEKGITYTPADGKFTVTRAGVYEVDFGLILISASVQLVEIRIEKNAVEIWSSDPRIHSSVDPVYRGMTGLKFSLAALDELTVFVDGASSNITVDKGGTIGIKRVE